MNDNLTLTICSAIITGGYFIGIGLCIWEIYHKSKIISLKSLVDFGYYLLAILFVLSDIYSVWFKGNGGGDRTALRE